MNKQIQNDNPVFGCFELDAIGTILYTKIEAEGIFGSRKPSVIGQNFFDEVAPFANIEDFRGRFNRFIKSRDAAENFTFNCRVENSDVPAKVMLTQINEHQFNDHRQLVMVDIRKA